jgi:alpha-ketoglutarate-dependent taurine dioxygenase
MEKTLTTASNRPSSTRCGWIIGLEDKEALALIDELMRHATNRKYEYRHKWRFGDWV